MKASQYGSLTSRLEQMSDLERRNFLELFLIPIMLKSPELFIRLLLIVFRLLKILAETFFDRNGVPHDPWWVRVLGVFGISFARKMRAIGDEADQTIKEMELPDIL